MQLSAHWIPVRPWISMNTLKSELFVNRCTMNITDWNKSPFVTAWFDILTHGYRISSADATSILLW